MWQKFDLPVTDDNHLENKRKIWVTEKYTRG